MSFCKRCYHAWKRRKEQLPKVCPKCKSPYWNKLRRRLSKEAIKRLNLAMVKEIIGIHDNIINLSGGLQGIREQGGIYNSVDKLFNYQIRHKDDAVGLGAFILNEFAKRHYFNDGNKRTSYVLAKIFMLINRLHLITNYHDSVSFLLGVAKDNSNTDFQEIKKWLKSRCQPINQEDTETYLKNLLFDLVSEVKKHDGTN